MSAQFKILMCAVLCYVSLAETFACDCKGQATVENAIKNSSLVVTGTVISKILVAVTDSHQIVSFTDDSLKQNTFRYTTIMTKCKVRVGELFKGTISSDTLTIFTGTGGPDCGKEFIVGEKYIIYSAEKAYSKQKYNDLIYSLGKNIFWTDKCTRTTQYDSEEIFEIKKFEKEKPLTTKK
jgi:hypothetical protein